MSHCVPSFSTCMFVRPFNVSCYNSFSVDFVWLLHNTRGDERCHASLPMLLRLMC